MSIINSNIIVAEKLRAITSVEEFLSEAPSIIEIQAYVQMARNDLAVNPHDIYAQEIINLLSGA